MRILLFLSIFSFVFAQNSVFDNLDLKKRHETYLLPVSYHLNHIKDDRKRVETKFQISLEKKLFEFWDFETNFAYTQTSFWQIFEDSAPFRETNYAPEIYIRKNLDYPFFKNYEFGLLHHSNGKSGEDSRSWNRIFISSKIADKNWQIIPKIWYKIKEKNSDNPRIADFYGYAEIRAKAEIFSQILSLNLRRNLKTSKGAIEFGCEFPLFDSGVSGYLQYFSGYGESLIDYDTKIDKIGLGFMVSF